MHRRISRQILHPWRNNYLPTSERGCYGCECREMGMHILEEIDESFPYCEFDLQPMEPHFPIRRELVDQYDICDWKWYDSKEPRNYRK